MPIMGGVEALRQARAAGIDMPIIALTASVEPDELRVGTATVNCSPRHMIERRMNKDASVIMRWMTLGAIDNARHVI